jgi:hypothetical protein
MTRRSTQYRRHPNPIAKTIAAVFNVSVPARPQPAEPLASAPMQRRPRTAYGFGPELARNDTAARALKVGKNQ